MTDEERLKLLTQVHPEYRERSDAWVVLLDAFEGTGGFLDGSYLWPYPREADVEFANRRKMARYHNYLEALVDLYVRFMFTAGVRRNSTSADYNAWLEDVDGAGTRINDFLKRFASVALVQGHAGLLVDKTRVAPTGPTKAEEVATVVARIFTATATPDWRFDGNTLSAIKLIESAPQPDITTEMTDARQYLLWDTEGWARFDEGGRMVSADTPGLGLVPFVVLRPKPSQVSRMLGRALVSNANVIRALFNRASEEDEVLRDQAFSILTVSVGPDGDVDDARASLGSVIGSAKALVVKGELNYKTPDQSVPGTIRDNMSYLVQEIYRAAHVRLQRDSLAAESGESIRLQYTELNEMLQGFAKSLAQAEQKIARAYFAWTTATPELAQRAFDAAKIEAVYPEEFFLDALMTDIESWAESIRLRLGPTMTKHIKKKAVRRIEPTMLVEDLAKIDKEIDAMSDEELMGEFPLDTGVEPPPGGQPPRGRKAAEDEDEDDEAA